MKRFLWALSGIIAAFLIVFNSGFTASALTPVLSDDYDLGFSTSSGTFSVRPYNSCTGFGSNTEMMNSPAVSGAIYNAYIDIYIGGGCSGDPFTLVDRGIVSIKIATKNISLLATEWIVSSARVIDISLIGNQGDYSFWEISFMNTQGSTASHVSIPINLRYTGTSQVGLTPYINVQSITSWGPKAGVDVSSIDEKLGNLYTSVNSVINKLNLVLESNVGTKNAITEGNQQAHQDAQAALQEQQKQTEAIEQTKDFVTDTSTPEAGDIVNSDSLPSVGLLPAGPLDSILLLPVNILNSIIQSFGGNCQPVIAPLPFVGENLTFPCFSDTFYTGSMAPLATLLGGVASAFILYKYFKHLYKKVDRAVSLETTDEDEWGIL